MFVKTRIRSEIDNFIVGLFAAFVTSLFLIIWRILDRETFLFLQIIVVCIMTYLLFFLLSNRFESFRGREMVATLIAFTLISFTTLNIDRSRSFFLLKWVGQYESTSGVSIQEIAKMKSLTETEVSAIQQRVQEQKQSIMLTGSGANLRLTTIGRIFVKACSFLAHLFNLQGYIKA